ncbi:rhamnogalacturonan acetylesterase [Paenibacillus hexagrammi]|uniref:GDSL-type esterase/lipase family protein n=1 Tax=Paenibacillus hexagrammi TaxID=2908839 RepID=A0ABY3SN77_9BACL|nr:rhamnogalacturonan acetylesterase [Paenibacillus sp. YPD9-1]UJF35000.1 GDSL-type esterase/lipase family protein [Paenibacillus sp. YPD9-1]
MGNELKFDFGPGVVAEGYTQVLDSTVYTEESGYGFLNPVNVYSRDRGVPGPLRRSFCIPAGAVFQVAVPSGNYRVEMTIGDQIIGTRTTLKAGEGRLIAKDLQTNEGEFAVLSFTVHVSDGKLRLAFSGAAPRVNAMHIAPAVQVSTLYLAGDSTVTDQPADGYPYAGWGQMLPYYFKADAAVANYAVSGRSSKSFIHEGRLDVIASQIRKGDYLFIQFGHNDQKMDEERHTSPYTTYKEHLQKYIDAARIREAIPILITPVHRRFFDEDGSLRDTHGDYITAMKELAEEQQVILLDLAAKSKVLYEQLGAEESKSLFLWAWPGEFPNFPRGAEDNTHFQELGAIQIAGLVVACIREQNIQPLALYLR